MQHITRELQAPQYYTAAAAGHVTACRLPASSCFFSSRLQHFHCSASIVLYQRSSLLPKIKWLHSCIHTYPGTSFKNMAGTTAHSPRYVHITRECTHYQNGSTHLLLRHPLLHLNTTRYHVFIRIRVPVRAQLDLKVFLPASVRAFSRNACVT